MNNARYSSREATVHLERLDKPGKDNAQFLQSTSPSPVKGFSSFRILGVQGQCKIYFREGQLEYCGNKYELYRRLRLC